MKHILTDSLTPYVGKVLSLYLELPETPLRTNLYDQKCAAELIRSKMRRRTPIPERPSGSD